MSTDWLFFSSSIRAVGDSANCNTAFFVSDDNQVQVACQEDNVSCHHKHSVSRANHRSPGGPSDHVLRKRRYILRY